MRKINAPMLAIVSLSLALVSACSPALSDRDPRGAASEAATGKIHAESGLSVIPLVVKTKEQTHEFEVEIAISRMEQARGLMFRTRLASDEGMLFPFDPPREAGFWMKNTVIPLDIIFIGADGRILNIEANAVPYSETQRRSRGKAAAVLELAGGQCARLGIAPGDNVTW